MRLALISRRPSRQKSQYRSLIEQFSNACRKNKVITPTDHSRSRYRDAQIILHSEPLPLKAREKLGVQGANFGFGLASSQPLRGTGARGSFIQSLGEPTSRQFLVLPSHWLES